MFIPFIIFLSVNLPEFLDFYKKNIKKASGKNRKKQYKNSNNQGLRHALRAKPKKTLGTRLFQTP